MPTRTSSETLCGLHVASLSIKEITLWCPDPVQTIHLPASDSQISYGSSGAARKGYCASSGICRSHPATDVLVTIALVPYHPSSGSLDLLCWSGSLVGNIIPVPDPQHDITTVTAHARDGALPVQQKTCLELSRPQLGEFKLFAKALMIIHV